MSGNGAPAATDDEKKRAVILHTRHHLEVAEIAAEMGRSYTGIYGWLRDAGVLRRTKRSPAPPPTEDEKHHAVTLYTRDNLTIRDVADKTGRSYGVVQGWLKAAGVLRPHVTGWTGKRKPDPGSRT